MSQSQSVVLPTLVPEITDEIIDHLHDDIPPLATCSLTCRDWLHSSRYHMFADLKLRLDKTQSLIDIFQHPNGSNIRAVVQRLVLVNLDEPTQYIDDDFNIEDGVEAQAAAAQRRALRYLGNCLSSVQPIVKHVRLCSGDRIITLEAALFLLSHMKGSVTHLELLDFTLIDFSYALDIIYTFPLLDTLLFERFSLYYDDRPNWSLAEIQAERIGQGPSSLTIIKCPNDSTQIIISWALTLQPAPGINIPVMDCEASGSRGAREAWRTTWLSPLISVEHLRIKFVDELSIEGGTSMFPVSRHSCHFDHAHRISH
jgi:hypothetical protein